ncbi:hypothetical protein PENANT_c012G10397 [Penicillium antarcticum]|uniref:EthD domain-containing protein n=1 Tax=Penicillium antarcticum TaxID=416450 RepID=A0A1V6Q642_9EURO|nr:hypothetical protein PENANT_c012G10397 [Penicillium antarcticum]
MAGFNHNLRVTVVAYKKAQLSEEESHKHWSEIHAPVVAEFLAKVGVVRYTQVLYPGLRTYDLCFHFGSHYPVQNHTPSSVRRSIQERHERSGDAHPPFPDYDGLVDIVVPDIETSMSLSKRNFCTFLPTYL